VSEDAVRMTDRRRQELETLASALLMETARISPDRLAERAGISWFVARDVLQSLTKRGVAAALKNGCFRRTSRATETSGG
jgi:predicted transcriptional regulator